MKRIAITSNNPFRFDGEMKMKIKTEGINLSRFLDNPIMLFNHNVDNVIGVFEDLEIEGDTITAKPVFDDDNDSQKIAKKYEKGTIKTASIGIDVLDLELDVDGTVVITESELYEVSLASIPQNPKASTTTASNPSNGVVKMHFAVGAKDKLDELKKRLNLSVVVEEPLVLPVIENVEPEVEEVEEVSQEVVIDTEDVEPIQPIESADDKIAQLIGELEAVKNELQSLKEAKMNVDNELEASRNASGDLKSTLIKMEDKLKDKLFTDAVKLGKVSVELKSTLISKAVEELESTLESLPIPQNVSLLDSLNLGRKAGSGIKSYKWYLANDKKALAELERNNPELVKQLQAEFLKTK